MRRIEFEPTAFEQMAEWADENTKLHKRIYRLILDSARDPFGGIAKPEPLKGNLRGKWSKRITDEHRLVYSVTDEVLTVFSCKFRYEA